MAYGIGEESIAQYFIEHGADQDALDSDDRKPIDYKPMHILQIDMLIY